MKKLKLILFTPLQPKSLSLKTKDVWKIKLELFKKALCFRKVVTGFTIYYLLSTVMAGCGYTTKSYIGPYETIYVMPFKNSIDITNVKSDYVNYISYYPLLESTITQAVVNRFTFDGNLKIAREENADLIIKGELISYQRGALRYALDNETVQEYRLNLIVNIGLYKGKDGTQIWQKDSFAGETTYFISGPNAKSEKAALDAAISDLARRIVEEVVEAW